MNHIPIEIFGEILLCMDHETQLAIRSVCNKWKEIIDSKKYVKNNTHDLFDICIRNELFFFDRFIRTSKHNNFLKNIYFRSESAKVAYSICKVFKHNRLASMIKRENYNVHETRNYIGILRRAVELNDKYFDVYLKLVNYDKMIIAYDIYSLFKFSEKQYIDLYFPKIIKLFSIHIIKKIFVDVYYCSDLTDNYIYNIIVEHRFDFFADVTILYDFMLRYSSKKIIKLIKDKYLKIKSNSVIRYAVKYNRWNLTKYLLGLNPRFIKCERLLRFTIYDLRKIPIFSLRSRIKSKNEKILQLLLSFRMTSYIEKKKIMMYAIKLESYDSARIFIEHGISINIDPRCFIMKYPTIKKLTSSNI